VDENKSIKITSAMVSAGVRILRESGVLFPASSGDGLLVREFLEKALSLQRKAQARCKAVSSKRGTQGESGLRREGKARQPVASSPARARVFRQRGALE